MTDGPIKGGRLPARVRQSPGPTLRTTDMVVLNDPKGQDARTASAVQDTDQVEQDMSQPVCVPRQHTQNELPFQAVLAMTCCGSMRLDIAADRKLKHRSGQVDLRDSRSTEREPAVRPVVGPGSLHRCLTQPIPRSPHPARLLACLALALSGSSLQ